MTLALLRRSIALVLALALFAPGSAFGRLLFACSMSGKVSAERCCCHRAKVHAQKAHAQRVEPPKAERRSCCEVQDHRRAIVPASTPEAELPVLAAAQGELLPAIPELVREGDLRGMRPHAARGAPPRLKVYATNCSLLI